MLHEPSRHEALQPIPWDESRVRETIAWIVRETEASFDPERYWPVHPLDAEADESPKKPMLPLYFGSCGVLWALHYLGAVGAATLTRRWEGGLDRLAQETRDWLTENESSDLGSFMMGETPVLMLDYARRADPATTDRLLALLKGVPDSPTRELMWGSPGTLLAASFMHERTDDERWAELFRTTAARLRTQLVWSPEHGVHYWTQDLYGGHYSFIDAVHGYVGTALPLIRGRHLLDPAEWAFWEREIVDLVERTADWDGGRANWRAFLDLPAGRTPKPLMQYCHGAPGFVVNLAGMPGGQLDPLLAAGAEATWEAGPLNKGSNLCHGTGGNGYAFLKLWQRTGDTLWLERARAFAMHGIAQTEAHAKQYGMLRHSLWTGDPGFAIYLWDCINGGGDFPTLDVFFPVTAG
jgi:hypothetical protein